MAANLPEPQRSWRRLCTRLGAVLLGPVIFLAFYELVPPLPRLELHGEKPLSLMRFSPDGKSVATTAETFPEQGCYRERIQVWDVGSGRSRLTINGDWSCYCSIAFSADGSRLIARFNGELLKCWDAMTGAEVAAHFDDKLPLPEVNRCGRWELLAEDCGMKVLESDSQREHGRLQQPGDGPRWIGPVAFRIAPDDRTVSVCRLSARPEPSLLATLEARVKGNSPPTVPQIHMTRLWNADTCEELAAFDHCHSAEFSPDGKTLATEHCDGTVRLWDLPIRKPLLADSGFALALWSAIILAIRLWDWWVRRPRRQATASEGG